MKHTLGLVDRQTYIDEAVTRVTPDEIGLTNWYNTRIELTNGNERRFAADFLTELGEVAVKGQRRLVTLGFISLDGEPLPLHTEYVMEDDGMLGLPDGEKHVAYLLGAGRPIDGFLNSILGTADAVQEEFEEHHQFQLV